MSQLKNLEGSIKNNNRFNQKFIKSDSLIEQEEEAAKRIMKIKKNIEFEDDNTNMTEDLGINMKNLFFKILEMLADRENPIPYIMANSKRQFTFAIMVICNGGLLMFFSNLMILN